MSTGLKANNDGSAAIQVGGTDYIQISSTGNVTIPQSQTISGNLTVTGTATVGGQPVGGNYIMRTYISPSPWTAPAALKAVKVTVIGSGGNGGSASTTAPSPRPPTAGGGGGSGGLAIAYYDVSGVTPLTITAGVGTNSFGALVSCTAGAAGGAGTNGSNGGNGAGGTVTPSPGIQISSPGFSGARWGAATRGGDTYLMYGVGGSADGNGNGYGAGGGGGTRAGTPTPLGTTPGGTGTPGIVIVEEFY